MRNLFAGVPHAKDRDEHRKIVARLERDGWINAGGGKHDIWKHPQRPGRIVVPRHREQSPGVAREIAKTAGWI